VTRYRMLRGLVRRTSSRPVPWNITRITEIIAIDRNHCLAVCCISRSRTPRRRFLDECEVYARGSRGASRRDSSRTSSLMRCASRSPHKCCCCGTTGKTPGRLSQKPCPALFAKIFSFPKIRTRGLTTPSRAHRRARRDRHERRVRDAMDVRASKTNDAGAYGQAVWSCPLDAGVKFAEMISKRRWLSSPTHRGEHGAADKTIVQGMPDCFG